MKNKRLMQIIIAVSIVLVIVGIFIYKNSGGKDIQAESTIAAGASENNGVPSTNALSSGDADIDDFTINTIDMEELTSYGNPIIIDFGTPSCTWCKKMEPILEKYYNEKGDSVVIRYVDLWSSASIADELSFITAVPTQVFFNADGTPYSPGEDIKKTADFETYKDTSAEKEYTYHVGALSDEVFLAILNDMVSADE